MKKLDVAIIGAGAAGMAAALKLYKSKVNNIMLFDRNLYLGGILKQCIHLGFGLSYFGEELTGPQYAKKIATEIASLKIPCVLDTTVTDISLDLIITTTSSVDGIQKYKAKTVIIATGCRERTRENLEVAGSRPAGIYTAGLAQTLINLHNYRIGNRVVIQGSGDIGLIMARRMAIEGYKVVAVLEKLPYLNGLIRNKVQCLDHFKIPLFFSSQITEICGKNRVQGIYVNTLSGGPSKISFSENRYIQCDTILFAVGLISELEVARKAGIELKNEIYPKVNSRFESNVDGIFFCGNCLHINDLADNASIEGEHAALAVCDYLKDTRKYKETIKSVEPYKEIQKNQKYTHIFFESLDKDQKIVCINCPNSCLLSNKFRRCKRGIEYFKNYNITKPKQYFISSLFDKKSGKNIPIKSTEPIEISEFRRIKKKLITHPVDNSSLIKLNHHNKTLSFTLMS